MVRQGSRRARLAWAAAATLAVAAPASASPVPAGVAAVQPNTPQAGSHLLIDAKGTDAGFRPNSIPTSLGWAFEKGFTLDASAAPGKCTVDQAKKQQCPADSRLGAGAIGVMLPGDHATAKIDFFRADPPQPGDQSGIILYFNDAEDGYSDAGIGSIRTTTDGNFGELIRFDKLPLPPLPPGLQITLDHIQLDFGAGSASAPPAVPGQAPATTTRHKVRLPCRRYRPRHGPHRRCVAYRHGRRYHLPSSSSSAHASAAGSFITNPATCDGDGWTIQLQVDYKGSGERREAQAPCSAS
jgi:hypothetical protein